MDSVTEELSILCVWAGDGNHGFLCAHQVLHHLVPRSVSHSSSFICFLNVLTNTANSAEAGSKLLTGKGICRLSLKFEAVLGLLAKDSEVVRCRFIKTHDAWEGHGDPTDMTYLFQ